MTRRDLLILGNVNVDLILGPLEQWPDRGTERLVETLEWRLGGNAGNAALAARGLGMDYQVISTVGNDLAGTWLQSQLQGPQVTWLPHVGATSVTVAVSHPDGERTFITQLGHLKTLDWPTLMPHMPGSRTVLLAGAFLTPALRRSMPEMLEFFGKAGTQIALDMGWPDGGFTRTLQAEVMSWLPWVNHLLINDLEARALTGESSVRLAARRLVQLLPPRSSVVIKCGADGALLVTHEQEMCVPAPQVQVIDTVGAGDTWNAAYLHALCQGQPFAEAARFAVAVASRAISTSPRLYLDGSSSAVAPCRAD